MKTFKLVLLGIFIVFGCVSCTEEPADIKKLYNSGESFKIDFPSWETFDQSVLKSAEIQFPGVTFIYSKKNNYAHVVFDDASHGEYIKVRYNKLHSDDLQVCLQNDDVRFVIMNNGNRYALKMFYWQNLEWNELAYFNDGKSLSVDAMQPGGAQAVTFIPILIVVVLVVLLIWGLIKKRKSAIIISSVLLVILVVTASVSFFIENRPVQTTQDNAILEKRVPIDSLISSTDSGFTDVYERPDGNSSVIGKIYNDDNTSYPVFSTDGPWYEIEYNGGTGYVYERDCILQSGIGDI